MVTSLNWGSGVIPNCFDTQEQHDDTGKVSEQQNSSTADKLCSLKMHRPLSIKNFWVR